MAKEPTITEIAAQCVQELTTKVQEFEKMRNLINDINLVLQSSHSGRVDVPRTLVLTLHHHKLMSDDIKVALLHACDLKQAEIMRDIMPAHRTPQ